MARKIIKKSLSVILVIAVFVSAITTSVIGVNAAEPTYTYSVVGEAIATGQREATVYVTLTNAAGFTGENSFDLMFDDSILDTRDENGNPYQDVDTNDDGIISKYVFEANEADGATYYAAKKDEDGNLIESGDVIYNKATYLPNLYSAVYEPEYDEYGNLMYWGITNVYDEDGNFLYYHDVSDETKTYTSPEEFDANVKNKLVQRLTNTKIEIVDGVKADSEFSISDFTNSIDTDSYITDGYIKPDDKDDDRIFKATIDADYTAAHALVAGTTTVDGEEVIVTEKEASLGKYYRGYNSELNVVTDSLSYEFATVTEDADVVSKNTLYAEGFKNITFDCGNENSYTSVTFKVTFDFSGRTDRPSSSSPDTVKSSKIDGRYGNDNYIFHAYSYKLNVNNITLNGTETEFTDASSSAVTDKKSSIANAFHVHNFYFDKASADYEKNGNGIAMATGTCGNCKCTSRMMVVDDDTYGVFRDNATKYYYNGYRGISGINVVYQNNGSLSLNIHINGSRIADELLLIADEDGNLYKYSDTLGSDSKYTETKSFFADVQASDSYEIVEKRVLGRSATMITIDGLSAKDIDKKFYVARYTPNKSTSGGETAQMGRTYEFSIADYCESIINDNDVYYIYDGENGVDSDASADEYKEQDKQVAYALINYGAAAKAVFSTQRSSSEKNIVYVQTSGADNINNPDGSFITDAAEGVGDTADNPYIISSASQLRYLVQKSTYATTNGKFFAIDPSIDVLCLQTETWVNNNGGIDKLMSLSASEVEELFAETPAVQWQGGATTNTDCFSGYFNGNGVEIVGLYTKNFGLFGYVNEGADFSNLTVRNSYIKSGNYAGSIVGQAKCSDTYTATTLSNNNCYGVVSFEKCTIKDNYIASTGNNARAGALLGGCEKFIGIKMDNCLVYGNSVKGLKDSSNPVDGGLFGTLSSSHNGGTTYPNGSYSNSIILDCVPYGNATQGQAYRPSYFTNVYTDTAMTYAPCTHNTSSDTYTADYAGKIIQIPENTFGVSMVEACPNLDWDSTWTYGALGEYPSLASPDYVAEGKTLYWSGESSEPADTTGGTEDNPIIISTAEELAWLVKQKADTTLNKYYKIADGIDNIILQPEGTVNADILMSCDSYLETKVYLTETVGSDNLENWSTVATGVFNGNFDGNGVTIYGLYANQTATNGQNAGLFGFVEGGGTGTGDSTNMELDNVGNTIGNFNIKNSYFLSNTRVAVVAPCVYGTGGGGYVYGKITYDTISVVNCYIESTNSATNAVSRAGVICAESGSDLVAINNCLVYGNFARNTALNIDISLYGVGPSSRSATSNSDNSNFIYNMITNTISIDVTPYNTYNSNYRNGSDTCFSNVYTNVPTQSVNMYSSYENYSNGTVWKTINYSNLTKITVSDLIGTAAQDIVNALNAANDSTVWCTGNRFGYPGFEESENQLPQSVQVAYNSLEDSFVYDDYANSNTEFGVYISSLSLKANPYMAITFAFHKEYKNNRDKISVRFETSEDGVTYDTTESISVAASTDEDGDGFWDLNDGWVNNEGAGRYHLYRLDEIDVTRLAYGVKVYATYDGGDEQYLGFFTIGGFALNAENSNKKAPSEYAQKCYEAAKALQLYAMAINNRYA